jgi:hypothetical protein
MRLVAKLFAVASFAVIGLVGCLGDMPSGAVGGNGASGHDTPSLDAGVGGGEPDLAIAPDLARPATDLRSTDLAGLVDCFGATVCDPTQSFCMRLHSGSQAAPGTTQSPACYEPADCMGANMNCDCITQDATLSTLCPVCVDNQDGTYDCYAQQ